MDIIAEFVSFVTFGVFLKRFHAAISNGPSHHHSSCTGLLKLTKHHFVFTLKSCFFLDYLLIMSCSYVLLLFPSKFKYPLICKLSGTTQWDSGKAGEQLTRTEVEQWQFLKIWQQQEKLQTWISYSIISWGISQLWCH